jgi:hypothetical protein
MRILLMHHFPLGQSQAGSLVRIWSLSLESAGHETRLLIVDRQSRDDQPLTVERVVCRAGDPAADLAFDVPQFSASQGLAFRALSDSQLAAYRDQLRRHLDAQIDRFDPHVIHAQHIWVQGQLALETGVPYVLNAWGPELIEYQSDARYRTLADQAAENASRILVPDEGLLRQVRTMFAAAADRTLLMPPDLNPPDGVLPSAQVAAGNGLAALYQEVLDERFGQRR